MASKLWIVALVLALVAMSIRLFRSREPAAVAATPVGVDASALEARIGSLESAVEALRRELAVARAMPAVEHSREPVAKENDPRVDELAKRITKIEEDAAGAEPTPQLFQSTRPGPGTSGMTVDDAITRALDRTGDEGHRLGALRFLRGQKLADGTDARLAVLDEMLALARTSTNGDSRADVWRQLSHVTDSRLVQPLLDALAFDDHAKAREEAAETLGDFLPNSAVEAALRAASEHDADADVRKQAAESLTGGH